jgi:hypothetical protein
MLLVGAAKRTITPNVRDQPLCLAGDPPGRLARRVLDELWARALALRCGRETVVWLSLDLLALPYSILRQVRRQLAASGPAAGHVLVTCTRNHAAPDLDVDRAVMPWSRRRPLRRAQQAYVRTLSAELVAVVHEAMAALQPARAHLACGSVPDIIGGASQRELSVAHFQTPGGVAIATLANYPLVPQVLGPDNDAISADFLYAFYRAFEGDAPPGQLALYACAEAREDPPPAYRSRSPREAARVGAALADAVRSLLGGPASPVEGLRLWRVLLPVERRGGRALVRAPGAVEGEVALLEFGPARVALLPGLIAPQVGREVRRMLDVPCRFVAGPANGDLGRLEPQGDADRGASGGSLYATLALDALDRLLLEAQA